MPAPIDAFIQYLLLYGSLNAQQTDYIAGLCTLRDYNAGDYFLKAGQVSREVAFVVQGVFRVCYYDHEGAEHTRYFVDERHLMADVNSFNTGLPSAEYVQAVTDCSVVVLSRKDLEALSATIVLWDGMVAKMTAKALADKVARVSWMMPLDAQARYQYFLEHFPGIANRVPLQYVASYIGVTQSSLSRLRRALAKKSGS
jgi:CRP-like cAMP-binding protein